MECPIEIEMEIQISDFRFQISDFRFRFRLKFTVRSTRISVQMLRYTVNSPMCRTKFYQSSLFPRLEALWNSLTNECFPPDYDLTGFKGRVNKFLLLKLMCVCACVRVYVRMCGCVYVHVWFTDS